MNKKIIIEEAKLAEMYITANMTVAQIAKSLNISTSAVNRALKAFNIKKSEDQRKKAISMAKQSKSVEDKIAYAAKISMARKGKGLGIEPWNKGKHPGNKWLGRHHTEEAKRKIIETKAAKSPEEKASAEAKRLASRVYGTPWNKGKHTGKWADAQKKLILAKQYETKKQNNSFNSSKPEDTYYAELVARYGQDDVIRQYSGDSRYPFNCDFYIKSLDLFIELNISWTHGGHLYDASSTDDSKKLHAWELKAKTSEYYKNAIETWTVRDVAKHKTAVENKLNYIVYYTEIELLESMQRLH